MAIQIGEVMNTEVYAVRPDETVDTVRKDLTRLGISGAPVTDERGRVVGVVSLKDVAALPDTREVRSAMSTPPLVAAREMPIALAARLMTEANCHRLIVVDDERVVGVVGALDVMRAQLGLPTRHPGSFPHYDVKTGTVWSDDVELDWPHLEAAPERAGVVLVLRGGQDVSETVIWGECSEDLRTTVTSYLDAPAGRPGFLSYWRGRGRLRFRTSIVDDPKERIRVLTAACS